MQTEQSNSQMPVQSSLDVDGGVPYEEKVMAAVAMQHLLSAPERDRDGREGAGQGEGRDNSGLRRPPAGPGGKKKKLADRKASAGSAGRRSEQCTGATPEARSRRSAANSASRDALQSYRLADQNPQLAV